MTTCVPLGWTSRWSFHDAPQVTLEQLSRAHASGYVAEVLDLMQRVRDDGAPRAVDPDTVVGGGTLRAALRSAGAAVAATDEVLSGRAANAFCACARRATTPRAARRWAFCFFNNVCVAARHALDVHGLQRVAIIDFDVHHGNGTEDIIAGDERVLMASFFQHPLYPFSGGTPLGTNMVNLPIPAYSRGAGGARDDRDDVDAAAGGLQAADAVHQRRLRRAPRGRAGPDSAWSKPTMNGSPGA